MAQEADHGDVLSVWKLSQYGELGSHINVEPTGSIGERKSPGGESMCVCNTIVFR